MSVAVGLSFTGCGSSSNGGSTGSSFEPVPLISDNYDTVTILGTCSGFTSNATKFELYLYMDGECLFAVTDESNSDKSKNFETHEGTWEATQSSNNTYQIAIKNLTQKYPDNRTCTMTCGDLLKLTIPENKLEDFRRGDEIKDATLEGSFTHTVPEDSLCRLGESIGATSTITFTLTVIHQGD